MSPFAAIRLIIFQFPGITFITTGFLDQSTSTLCAKRKFRFCLPFQIGHYVCVKWNLSLERFFFQGANLKMLGMAFFVTLGLVQRPQGTSEATFHLFELSGDAKVSSNAPPFPPPPSP